MSVAKLQRALKAQAKAEQASITSDLKRLTLIHAERLTSALRGEDHAAALQKLARDLSRLQACADLSGRIEIRFPSRAAPVPEQFAASVVADVVPTLPFLEAIKDLEQRDPVGAAELRLMGLEVEQIYGPVTVAEGVFYPHGFTLAKAQDAETAQAVQKQLVVGMSQGKPISEIVDGLVTTWTWPQNYAANVVRTTFNTATTAGRFIQAEHVAESGVPTGFRFETAGDVDVRSGRPQDNGENHAALDGMTARVDDPCWDRWSPPGGWQCRCVLIPVIGDEVPIGFVTVPFGASFAPGFGRKPSRSGVYSGS